MISQRQLFLNHVAQTTENPLGLQIESAKGVFLYDNKGKKYLDLISGIGVSNLGHGNEAVIEATKTQLDKHMHLMVYGEYIQQPQVDLAQAITNLLPEKLSSVYFVNSGSEACEGALKLAKKHTGRTHMVSCKNSYHGSTHGALSVMHSEEFKGAYRPLLPNIDFAEFNSIESLQLITKETACFIVETVQGEAGALAPSKEFLQALRARCTECGTLLIFDEIQCAMGRTGKMFAFEHFDVIPDILLLAKAFGGGMPLGAFISSKEIMHCLTNNPILGHITTFGGHPVSCAAALEALNQLQLIDFEKEVKQKEQLFRKLLVHTQIAEVTGIGLMLAVQLPSEELMFKTADLCVEKGIIIDWFLHDTTKLRIAPPIIISELEITKACNIIITSLDEAIAS
ncbi:MAG: acetylornithine/N-succinyldiaminopimelate aminotransferase [Sphingobacteriales bacterium]|jgi:acetylornithine/N-succinyldiaminopimelate aminotransferase